MDILLIAGLWLGPDSWDQVVPELAARGHLPRAIALPGQGDGVSAGLADQVAAVVGAVDDSAARSEGVVVVGHSAATSLAWMAVDARPERVAAVVLIGGFPGADGEPYAGFAEVRQGWSVFPGWEPFEGPDADDLDAAARRRFEERAVPVAEAVVHGSVRLTDDRRFAVPVYVVCPEFTSDQARTWIEQGEAPELAAARRVEFVDIDSGHWPMFTKPQELGGLLAGIADGCTT